VRPGTANVEAYDLYVRGRALLLKRGRHADEGTTCLRRAVELDPGFAAAWSGLADSYTVRGYWGVLPPGEVMPKGLTSARRAVSLDPHLAEAHSALAMALLLWERDFDASRAAFLRSLELNPHYVQGRCWYGQFQLQWVDGRMHDGVLACRQAVAADPLSPYATGLLAFCLLCAGEAAEGLECGRKAAAADPDSLLTHWIHGLAAYAARQFDEALAAYRRAEAISGAHPYPVATATVAYADAGRRADARANHARLVDTASRRHVPPTMLAMSAAAIGELDQAIELATQACDERDPVLVIVSRSFPPFRHVRDDPRFGDVLRRLRLP
jgi:tetratricopeptide (TPR) repeat protein